MGLALQVVTGFVTAPSSTFTAWTMAAGDSLTVRNAPLNSRVWLLEAWQDQQTAGNLRIRSPKLHDNVQGIRMFAVASETKPHIPWGYPQLLYPQDTLVAEQTGSATAGDIETGAMLIYYEDLPGSSARLAMEEFIMSHMVNVVTIENTLALGTAGGYSGEEAINAEFDLLKANTDYALLGYSVSAECAVVGWRGSDTANLRVGGPGDELGHDYTVDWFARLARFFKKPCIPIFNSANKAGILIDGVQDENGTDTTVTHNYAELKP
jgi:hypothetical protein